MIHTFLANYYKTNQQIQEAPTIQNQQKEWYETLGGLVILSIGLDLLSAFIYEKGKETLIAKHMRKERRREREHLMKYHGKTETEAATEEAHQEAILIQKEKSNSPL